MKQMKNSVKKKKKNNPKRRGRVADEDGVDVDRSRLDGVPFPDSAPAEHQREAVELERARIAQRAAAETIPAPPLPRRDGCRGGRP